VRILGSEPGSPIQLFIIDSVGTAWPSRTIITELSSSLWVPSHKGTTPPL